MKKNIICCFAGHRNIGDLEIKEKIEAVVRDLIENKGVTEFWVGNYGDFDRYAAGVIRELKDEYTNIKLVLTLAYMTERINANKELYEERYDTICLLGGMDNTPYRYRITKSNQIMVNNAEYIICYVKFEWGGAATTLRYAKRKDIKIINLAE